MTKITVNFFLSSNHISKAI